MALPAFSRHGGLGHGYGKPKPMAGNLPVSLAQLVQRFSTTGGVKQNAGSMAQYAGRVGGRPYGGGPRPVFGAPAAQGGVGAGGGGGHVMTPTGGGGSPFLSVMTPYGVMTAAQAAAMGLASTPYQGTRQQAPPPPAPPAYGSGWGWAQ